MTVSFYLDVHDEQRENVTTASVTKVLKEAATNNSFLPLEVKFVSLKYVIVGELSLISEESLCQRERENITGAFFLLRLRAGCLKHG